jgi:hypothetical protein
MSWTRVVARILGFIWKANLYKTDHLFLLRARKRIRELVRELISWRGGRLEQNTFPGRSAACKAAPPTRGLGKLRAGAIPDQQCTASLRYALHCIRENA